MTLPNTSPDQKMMRELVNERQHGWKEFNRANLMVCGGIVFLLILMWLVFMVILK